MKRSIAVFFLLAGFSTSAVWSQDLATTIEMVRVPAGCFNMGTQGFEKHEQPQHKVCLDSFDIGKFEVTQQQWRLLMGDVGAYHAECGLNCPVDQVSWNDAQEFIKKLNAQGKGVFRLPTEAEWEYACRSGGKDETWSGSNDFAQGGDIAWLKPYAGNHTHPVGEKKPNGLGIHDMSGNVWEWVQDMFVTPYPTGVEKNPRIDASAEGKRVIRGGSWDGKINYIRCGIRNRYAPDFRDSDGRVGVRLVREVAR